MPDQPKDRARKYIQRRQKEHKPPPSRDEIRRRLGWGMKPKVKK